MEQGFKPLLLTGGHRHLSSLCVPTALKPHAKTLLLSWSRALPTPSTKCCCSEIFTGTPQVPLGGETQPGEGAETLHAHPSLQAGHCPVLPQDAPEWGHGAEGSLLILIISHRLLEDSCSGEAELWGVRPAPAQGTELVPLRAGPFQGGSPGIQPPANPADEHAEDGGAEDDEDPGVHDGVHGEKAQGAEVSVLVEIGGKGPHVHPDLSEKHRNREE